MKRLTNFFTNRTHPTARPTHMPGSLRPATRLSGVLRTSCSGLAATSHAKSFVRFIAKPAHGSGAKATVEKLLKVFCFAPQPSLPTHIPMALQKTSLCFCHALCGSDVPFVRSVVPPSLTHCTHFTTCACTGLWPP